jgi:hypothetical protein
VSLAPSHEEINDKHDQQQPANAAADIGAAVIESAASEEEQQDDEEQNDVHVVPNFLASPVRHIRPYVVSSKC